MKSTPQIQFDSAFAEDTYKGLTSNPKYLYSKYIYDQKGDKLFQRIMNMPEYYLTSKEYSILDDNAEAISKSFSAQGGFDFIELGAGDGKKTKLLLKELVAKNYSFNYLPIDISQHALDELERTLQEEIPQVNVKTQQGTYFKTLEKLTDYNTRKKVIVVLGSNIGNLSHEKAIDFLKNIVQAMRKEDMLFMGFDQKKNPQTILDAYNDAAGITDAFNKNLLTRINSEFHANFDLDKFLHWESYNPETGSAKSFLVSKEEQEVRIDELDLNVKFAAWESIHTELSQKYDDEVVSWLAAEAGLKIETQFSDSEDFYKNYIFRVNDLGASPQGII